MKRTSSSSVRVRRDCRRRSSRARPVRRSSSSRRRPTSAGTRSRAAATSRSAAARARSGSTGSTIRPSCSFAISRTGRSSSRTGSPTTVTTIARSCARSPTKTSRRSSGSSRTASSSSIKHPMRAAETPSAIPFRARCTPPQWRGRWSKPGRPVDPDVASNDVNRKRAHAAARSCGAARRRASFCSNTA